MNRMNRLLLLLSCIPFFSFSQWNGSTTPTYPELIAYYKQLDAAHKEIELYAMGASDTDWPIYVCIINGAGDSLQTMEKARSSTTVLINNAIHAGEPDGVNASLIWIDNWIKKGKKTKGLPVIAIIPAYNVGGMFNRSSSSRANQDGPDEYGFRGNAQNLDLNRDFIKMDSENAFTFANIYHALDPDVFADTHVSNGADYQYTLTLISSMKERMAPSMRGLHDAFLPELCRQLDKEKLDLCPYVELHSDIPDKGIVAFNDLPRYAMGYASLFHSLSFTVETHMLKPFPQRVEATLQFLANTIAWSGANHEKIETARAEAQKWTVNQPYFRFGYQLTDKADSLDFKGYEAVYKTSDVTGQQRLSYDRSHPYRKNVPYFATHIATDSVRIPKYYVIQGACREVISRLEANGVPFMRIHSDSVLTLTVMQINGYETIKNPYEGHYKHYKVTVEESTDAVRLLRGAIIVPVTETHAAFLLSVLEPEAEDSYFTWNFFDSYLQQKEYFSAYVFEDKAKELLQSDPELARKFNERKQTDPAFATDAEAQLYFIYRNSAYFERSTANRLPVYKQY